MRTNIMNIYNKYKAQVCVRNIIDKIDPIYRRFIIDRIYYIQSIIFFIDLVYIFISSNKI